MLNIEDYAVHRTNGWVGKVVGYGHQMLNNTYLTTIKVHILKGTGIDPGRVIESLSSDWKEIDPNCMGNT